MNNHKVKSIYTRVFNLYFQIQIHKIQYLKYFPNSQFKNYSKYYKNV